MSRLRVLFRSARDSRGAVMVLVALGLPAFIGFAGLVIDVGNWFEHKRHLQLQADAGALAGAGAYGILGAECPTDRIHAAADSYSGLDYNAQIGGTPAERVERAYNSQTWPGQSSPIDETTVVGDPCAAGMFDVKITESELPWFLRLTGVVPFINAQARVELRKQRQAAGALPVGVPEVDPKRARAVFVDEVTGAVIASTDLQDMGDSNGLSTWSNVAAPLPVTIDAARIGVRIVLGGATSTTCGQPLVTCYDAGSANGLVHIRGWSSTPAGTAAAPQPRDVKLFGNSCEDGYFTAMAATSPCTMSVRATVDFGEEPLGTTRLYVKRADANDNALVALTPPATAGEAWIGGSVPVALGDGPVSVALAYKLNCPTDRNVACSGQATSLGTVQRAFGADPARSGPLKMVRVSENGVPGANSFERCATCTRNLVVTIGLQGSLRNASAVSDPLVTLKVAGGGSQNQALDCDPALPNLNDELVAGCSPEYEENTGQACPAGAQALWSTAQPWNCVAINTGATTNQVPQGLNQRILGSSQASTCTSPSNWADFPDIPPDDPRIVQVFLTPFGSFSGSGATTVPVTGFATFYVTGWKGSGQGFANPCEGQGDDVAGTGSIVGHFIKYVTTLNNGGAGEETCDPNAFTPCIAVLTR